MMAGAWSRWGALCAAGVALLCGASLASGQDVPGSKPFQAGQDAPYWIRGNHFQLTGEVVPIAEDGIHDPAVASVQVLQPPYEAMANFPRDSQGIIDWVKTLETGLIDPRKSLDGTGDMFPVDFDIIFKNTQSMPYVRFPHRQHTEWLTCANCHPLIFIPQKGANPVSMSAIIQGEYCGVCHGKVAFPPTMNCARCHSVAKEVTLLR